MKRKNLDLQELEKLINEWLETLDNSKEYWDGVFCSDKEMAMSFLIGQDSVSCSFLEWLHKKNDYTDTTKS